MKWIILIAVISLSGCTDDAGTKKILTDNGYTDVEVKGYGWVACGRDEIYSTEFTAISSSGYRVKGTVCKGFLKGSTIRFETE